MHAQGRQAQGEILFTEGVPSIMGGVYQVQWSASTEPALEGGGRQFMSVKGLVSTWGMRCSETPRATAPHP